MPQPNDNDNVPETSSLDPADFYSIVVESSGASPIRMTGARDVEGQDQELSDIFGIDL